jgi:hypothetical protein
MSHTSEQEDNPTTNSAEAPTTSATNTTSAKEKNRSPKKPTEPRYDLATAGGLVFAGIYLSYLPTDAHIPAFQGLFQAISYCCYAIGFLGGMLGLSKLKLSQNQFFESFGLGFILGLTALGLHWLADTLSFLPVVPFILRLLIVPLLVFTGFGLVLGISFL